MKLSILLPIYNEEESIEGLYQEIKEILVKLSLDCEIIAINDGSNDQSSEILRRIARQDRFFKVIILKCNYYLGLSFKAF